MTERKLWQVWQDVIEETIRTNKKIRKILSNGYKKKKWRKVSLTRNQKSVTIL